MVVDGSPGYDQALGDLGVAEGPRDQRKDFQLPCSQSCALFSRVDGRGPRGTPFAPSPRSRRLIFAARGRCAQLPTDLVGTFLSSPTSSVSESASAVSYGQPRRSHRAAASRQSPETPAAYGSGEVAFRVHLEPRQPAPVRQMHDVLGCPAVECAREHGRGHAVDLLRLPSSHASSASTAARSTIAKNSSGETPTPFARCSASCAPGSPRRPRTRARTTSAS